MAFNVARNVEYLEHMATLPPDIKSVCGWFMKGDCREHDRCVDVSRAERIGALQITLGMLKRLVMPGAGRELFKGDFVRVAEGELKCRARENNYAYYNGIGEAQAAVEDELAALLAEVHTSQSPKVGGTGPDLTDLEK